MRIVSLQYENQARVAVVENTDTLRLLDFTGDVYALAKTAFSQNKTMVEFINEQTGQIQLSYQQVIDNGLIDIPCMHPDSAHCLVSGTGLTHMGSADTRNAMHAKLTEDNLSDSMKMFKRGVDGGKPKSGDIGAEPEWFYKGDGGIVVKPNATLPMPAFAEDAGEEPEIAGIYLIDNKGKPQRIGFCVGNEFSDHIKEKQNYLLLAHSKLRPCSIGPEIYIGELPEDLQGTSRIIRDSKVIWEKPIYTGEANMVHSIANLEYHHFKYSQFHRPGDLHIHFFGTATLSFADNIKTKDGDIFEIEIPAFGRALRNSITYQS